LSDVTTRSAIEANMIWALIVVGILIGLILLVLLIGLALPKAHSASVAARYSQKPEAVFEAVSNWREYPTWRKDLKGVKERRGEPGQATWTELSKFGEVPLEIAESDPPRKLVAKIASDKLAFGGKWTYLIEPSESGCTLTITEDGEVYNPFFRIGARYILGYTATMKQFHQALSARFGQACEIASR